MLNGKYVTAHLFNTKLIDFANMLGSSNKDGCNQVRYTLKDVPDLSVLQGVRKCIFYKERSILVPIKTAKKCKKKLNITYKEQVFGHFGYRVEGLSRLWPSGKLCASWAFPYGV